MKKQIQRDNKVTAKKRLRQPEAQNLKALTRQTDLAALIQRARLDPDSLTPGDVLQLRHTTSNRTISGLVAGKTQGHLKNSGNELTKLPLSAQEALQLMRANHTAIIQRESETGLAGKKRVKSYTKTILKSKSGWDALSQNERINALMEPANEQLTKVGVPEVMGLIDPLAGIVEKDDDAAFSPGTWQVIFSPGILGGGLSDAEFGRLANTVYHECRHAEQTFRVARKLAFEGETAQNIARRLEIPRRIAEEATENPLSPRKTKEWGEAAAWQLNMEKGEDGESLASIVNAKKDTAMAEYNRARDLYRTLQKLFADPNDPTVDLETRTGFAQLMQTPEGPNQLRNALNQAQEDYIAKRERAKQAFLQYAKMPIEEDAWAVGALIEKRLGLPPHTAEKELENLDEDERTMMPVVLVALSTGSQQERELARFLQSL